MIFAEFQPGQRLSAKALNALVEEVRRLGQITTAPPLGHESNGGGVALWADLPARIWIKLTSGGTGGKYAWTRQKPVAGGTWAAYPGPGQSGTTGTDPAYEVNSNTTVDLSPNPVVRAWREPVTGQLLFQAGSC
jgi:hypothetical protein